MAAPAPASQRPVSPCCHFEFPEILIATKSFDESLVIGKGGFGKVYKGNVIYGASPVVAAIKRLDPDSSQGVKEFWSEVEILSTLRHYNIVPLIGYCNYEKEKILVYEYMPHGTLDDHLHKFRTPLSWFRTEVTRVKGSFGYFDPGYYQTGMLTRKSDVYAFGVVLLEVLCRKRAVDKTLDEDQWSLVAWVQDSIKEGKLKHIIDSDIRGEISPKCLKEFVKLADRCLQDNPKQRPTMVEVVASLKNALNIQERIIMRLVENRTIFGKMVDMLPFHSNAETYVDVISKLSSNNNDNNRIASNIVRVNNSMLPTMKEVHAHFQSPNPSLKEYTFDDLEKATKKFSPDLLLGEGGFGKVFLGWVEQNTLAPSKQGVGIAIAVKRFNEEALKEHAELLFQAEVNTLAHLAHPNIIRLLGYCRDEHERLLVYEYMANKSFDHLLFTDIAKRLSWGTRLSIMIGIARGLTYLHSENVIYRGLTSSNILLDDNFKAKLGDLGFVKYGTDTGETHVTTSVMGNYGYAAPEYLFNWAVDYQV